MEINLNIDDQLIQEALQLSDFRSEKEVVTQALLEFIKHHKQIEILNLAADNHLEVQSKLKASIDSGIARGLADMAAGNIMSSADCFDLIRGGLKEKYGQNN